MYEITEPLLQSQRRLEGTVAELTAQLTARDQEMVALREVTINTVQLYTVAVEWLVNDGLVAWLDMP